MDVVEQFSTVPTLNAKMYRKKEAIPWPAALSFNRDKGNWWFNLKLLRNTPPIEALEPPTLMSLIRLNEHAPSNSILYMKLRVHLVRTSKESR